MVAISSNPLILKQTEFMEDFNSVETEKKFYKGKRFLDSGRYREALEIYEDLIAENSKFLDNSEAQLLIETSLNNRGCAKCQIALRTNNKALYKSGMEDFQKSIEIDNPKEDEKHWLTAYGNLKFSEKEIEVFDRPRDNQQFNPFSFKGI